MSTLLASVLAAALLASSPAGPAGEDDRAVPPDLAPILLNPIPPTGAVPGMVRGNEGDRRDEHYWRARYRDYVKQIRIIERRYLGERKSDTLRAQGFDELREFTDPAAFLPMIEELQDQSDDVRLFVLDHFGTQGADGQGALAYVAVHANDPAMRSEATIRLDRPADPAVLRVIDAGLRSKTHAVANSSAILAGTLDAVEAIPLMIFAQATRDRVEQTGDLAWIAIGTTTTYVANVIPAVGDSSGAFQPVIGSITEGTLLRVMDAVAINYRVDVHRVLVSMSTRDWGQSTADLGYDMRKWYAWYNEEYVPHNRERQRLIELARGAATTGDGTS